jgi:hypothetical protein
MFEGLGNLVTTLFEGLDLRRRWLAIIVFGVLVVLSLLLFEQLTGTIYYSSLERRTELLKELNALEKEGNISSNPELKRVYDQTVQELSLRPIRPFGFPSVGFVSSVTFWKVISGAAVGLLFATVALLQFQKSSTNALTGAVGFAVIAGFIGGLLPVIYYPWINYIGFPIAQILFFTVIGRRTRTPS